MPSKSAVTAKGTVFYLVTQAFYVVDGFLRAAPFEQAEDYLAVYKAGISILKTCFRNDLRLPAAQLLQVVPSTLHAASCEAI